MKPLQEIFALKHVNTLFTQRINSSSVYKHNGYIRTRKTGRSSGLQIYADTRRAKFKHRTADLA